MIGRVTGVKRVGLVVNPTAGKKRGAAVGRDVADGLRAAGHEVVDCSAGSASGARANAVRAISHGIDVLVVCGGDGMAHLGVNVVAGTDTPLVVAAAGTGNDTAAAVGWPIRDPAAVVRVVSDGIPRRVDAARRVEADGSGAWFVGVLAAGFDSIVNERANRWLWPKGQMRYNLAILRELPVFTPIPYAITVDGRRTETEAMLVAVANGPSYGGGMRVAPDASFDDGLLDVVVVNAISRTELVKVFPKVFSGTHVTHPAVDVLRGATVRLEAERIVAYADGERYAALPLTCEVVPGALTVLT